LHHSWVPSSEVRQLARLGAAPRVGLIQASGADHMPASLLTEILFRGVFEVILYGLGYVVGWLVVPIFSFGRYSVEPWDFKSRRKSGSHSRKRRPKQVSADAACSIGLVTLAVASAIAYFVWRAVDA